MKLVSALIVFILVASAFSQTGVVRPDNTKLRGTPSEQGKVVEILAAKSEVELIKESGAWLLVQTEDYAGWLRAADLDLKGAARVSPMTQAPASRPQTSASAAAPAVVKDGRAYIRGPRGGCYYLSETGKKVYVDHDRCAPTPAAQTP